jgi:hypothetical protein
MVEFGGVVGMYIDEDSNLDIFEMSTKTNEPTKELVNKELQMFKKYHMDVKNIKCFLEWWGNMSL